MITDQRQDQTRHLLDMPPTDYAALVVRPDGAVEIVAKRTRYPAGYPLRYRLYRRISTASLHRIDRLVCLYASYTGTTQASAFVALLDLPG